MQLRAFGVHHFHQGLNDQRIETAQRRVFAHEQVGFGAEAVNHPRQLNGDIACADHRHALRQRRQFEETVGINTVFDARNIRVARPAAGGDQDMVSGDDLAVDFHGVGIDKAREAFDHVDFILTQYVVVRGMNTVDIGATAGDQLLPVKMVDGGIETVVRAVKMNRFADLRRMPHHLFRHAADVDAGAAQLFGFNQRALLAVHGRAVN
ncbi:Uncharacterised protein [Klebsiella pneumoniae]|nr:Uncharacterised protein [Klebsiella pneumoniae]